jgi:hypothetical protein
MINNLINFEIYKEIKALFDQIVVIWDQIVVIYWWIHQNTFQ